MVRIHASSGTTGKPITGPFTQSDLDQWTECMARNLYAAGVRSNDICQNAYGMGLFTEGLGFHQGATCAGCAVIPISSGQTERQIIVMQDVGVAVLFCTPTYDAGPKKIAEVEKMIESEIRGMIGIGIKIRWVSPKTITRSEGKAKRVIDERKM